MWPVDTANLANAPGWAGANSNVSLRWGAMDGRHCGGMMLAQRSRSGFAGRCSQFERRSRMGRSESSCQAPVRGHGWPPLWRDDFRSAEPIRLCRAAKPILAEALDRPERIIMSGSPARPWMGRTVAGRWLLFGAQP